MKKRAGFILLFGVAVFMAAAQQIILAAEEEPPQPQSQKQKIAQAAEDAISKALGNYLAVETGELKDKEKIPLPKYQDGTTARRNECRYFVSPKEISTAFIHLGGAGEYYITCSVDAEGVVHSSLWQHGADGHDLNVMEDKSYEDLKKYYQTIGTQYEGNDDFRNQLMAGIKKRLLVNYMVIAMRSSKK